MAGRKQKLDALERLRAARTGKKASDLYQVREEAALFEQLNEDEYQRRVQENRKQGFIEDDIGLGYDDNGEFEWRDEEPEEAPAEKNTLNQFLVKGRMKVKSAKKPKPEKPNTAAIMDEFMDLLDDDQVADDQILQMGQHKQQELKYVASAKKGAEHAKRELQRKYNAPPPVARQSAGVHEPQLHRKRSQPGADPLPQQPLVQDSRSRHAAQLAALHSRYSQDSMALEHSSELQYEKPHTNYRDQEVVINSVEFSTQLSLDPPIDHPMDHPMDYPMDHPMDSPIDPTLDAPIEPTAVKVDFEEMPTLQEEVPFDSSNIELPLNDNGELIVYWFDLFEDKAILKSTLLLFGKVWYPASRKYESISIAVKNIQRTYYVLPKPEFLDTPDKVFQEMEAVRSKAGIRRWVCRLVKRRYAFELPGVPEVATYFQFKYSAEFPELVNIEGETFTHLFGKNRTLAELFLVKNKIRGPCWLVLRNAKLSDIKRSHCRLEVVVEDPKDIRYDVHTDNTPPPKLSLLSLAIQTVRNVKNMNEVMSITGVLQSSLDIVTSTPGTLGSFVLTRSTGGVRQVKDYVVLNSEQALVNNFLARMIKLDPDILCGHELYGNILETLYTRFQDLKVSNFSRLGRVMNKSLPTRNKDFSRRVYRTMTAGRLLCDTFLASQELVRETNYTLNTLVSHVLGKTREELDPDTIPSLLATPEGIERVCGAALMDARYAFEITMQLSVIPLTKQLTNIAGNVWARSLEFARAERNEMILVHEFTAKNYICPDKEKAVVAADKSKYAGGLVLEPVAGLYDKAVLMLDFNSLYPSIIQEYNICFTTVPRPKGGEETNRPGQVPSEDCPAGILPVIIKSLVDQRKLIKRQLAQAQSELDKKRLDIKQQAFKLTANSMYGCLGFRQSRFYARPIAALITQLGRKALETAVDIAEKQHRLHVIYGDTDSIMINTSTEDVARAKETGMALKQSINKMYKCLEIEIDGIFKSMLLLRKKKYAVLKYINDTDTVREVKGLDMVRRDWCPLSKQASDQLLSIILSGEPIEDIVEGIKEYLTTLKQRMDNNEFSLGEYIITKQLTKAPEKYTDAKSQPHVVVAKKMIEQGQKNLVKHFIPYVICEGEGSVGERAHHPDLVMNSAAALAVDKDWYIVQQIFPPLRRLCEPINSLETGELAQCLGLDPNKYAEAPAAAVYAQSADFLDVEELSVWCKECSQFVAVTSQATKTVSRQCSAGHYISEPAILNALCLDTRRRSWRMQNSAWKCEDPTCGKESRLMHAKCIGQMCRGRMVPDYSIEAFHKQLSYWHTMFSQGKASSLNRITQYLKQLSLESDFQRIDLSQAHGYRSATQQSQDFRLFL